MLVGAVWLLWFCKHAARAAYAEQERRGERTQVVCAALVCAAVAARSLICRRAHHARQQQRRTQQQHGHRQQQRKQHEQQQLHHWCQRFRKSLRKNLKKKLNTQHIEELSAQLVDEKLCDVCCNLPKDHALGCGHVFCGECTDHLKRQGKCPMCRVSITTVTKLFI